MQILPTFSAWDSCVWNVNCSFGITVNGLFLVGATLSAKGVYRADLVEGEISSEFELSRYYAFFLVALQPYRTFAVRAAAAGQRS